MTVELKAKIASFFIKYYKDGDKLFKIMFYNWTDEDIKIFYETQFSYISSLEE